MHDRFFESTRGKIVGALRERRSASAFDLAQTFGLSPNAIRQQLVVLERDGLVAGHSVRRGKTKPTVEYSLTAEAERYFPQRYDKMLNAVLREIRAAGGDEAVQEVFQRIGKRSAEKLLPPPGEAANAENRLISLVESLKGSGVAAELRHGESGKLVLHEHNCPYASVVAEHPEACSAIHTILDTVAPGKTEQVESIATGGEECRFEIDVTAERETAAAS
ncbi:MAG TPA: helix-turn-helix domain-containing protein [Candidatus Limnocylindria bacterium]|jgi:predicted ArsR family transcriptional regulator|nr:helix-turn-helix domain-containing protein [Candidatus Limnocylindria bacterium]